MQSVAMDESGTSGLIISASQIKLKSSIGLPESHFIIIVLVRKQLNFSINFSIIHQWSPALGSHPIVVFETVKFKTFPS